MPLTKRPHIYLYRCRYCNHLIRCNENKLWTDNLGSDVCYSLATDKTLHEPKREQSMIDLNVLQDEHAILEIQDRANGKKVIYLHVGGLTRVRINIHESAGFEVEDIRSKTFKE